MKILFLEDDIVIGNIILEYLSDFYEVKRCYNSSEALKIAENEVFDLYIFDINVPGSSGLELLKSLRDFNDATPAIFITAYQELRYLKEGFNVGANDFIRKPFEVEELQVRIENIKHQYNIDVNIQISTHVSFNPQIHQLSINDSLVTLSNKESALLQYLIHNKNRVVSPDELLQNIWSFEEMPSSDTIRTYVKNLRHILGKERIINVRSKGYKFE